MFTGIVKGLFKVHSIQKSTGLHHLGIQFDPALMQGLVIGGSVAINGVCLTVVKIEEPVVYFDIIQETLNLTNLADFSIGDQVNVERPAHFGDEIGGHLLSGHIMGHASIVKIETPSNNHQVTFQASPAMIKYFFPKGYIALDGVSLTLVDVNHQDNTFSVHLIPETLRQTAFGFKREGSKINVEVDSQTQILVDCLSVARKGT